MSKVLPDLMRERTCIHKMAEGLNDTRTEMTVDIGFLICKMLNVVTNGQSIEIQPI